MANKFKPGDIVKIASGSPDMTVQEFASNAMYTKTYDDQYICVWFDTNNEPQSDSFHENVLVLVKSS